MKTILKKIFFFALAGSVFWGAITAAPNGKDATEKVVKDDEVIPPEVSEADKNSTTTEVKDSFYVRPKSYGTQPIDTTKPAYAKRLSETGLGVFKNIDWIIFGIEQRTRGEYHKNDYRQANATSVVGANGIAPSDTTPVLFKTRAFLKIENILDPLRLVVEFQDSRRTEAFYADTDGRDFNTFEPIQAYAELYFKNLFGYDRPLTIRGGRMAFEFLDRRLIGQNEWRNTTNTFQGGRITVGQEKNNWYLELLGLQPLQRYLYDIDQPVGKQWFYGGILSIQEWSHIATLQPYYLGLQQDGITTQDNSTNPVTATRSYRNFHTVGLRAYGTMGKTGFDYDISYTKQFGTHSLSTTAGAPQENQIDAFSFWGELGYTFKHSWKPRLAGFYGFISGDDPATAANKNGAQEGFDRLYGFGRPWSSNDYFRAENLNTPKIILEFEPIENLKIDTAYAWYWTADPHAGISGLGVGNGQTGVSPSASAISGLAAVTSGKIGEEYNLRIRYPFPHLKVNVGYAFFKAGDWLTTVKRGGDSHFAYLEVSALLFD
jgi:hypothetical protein